MSAKPRPISTKYQADIEREETERIRIRTNASTAKFGRALDLANRLGFYAMISGCAYFMMKGVEALAGKETHAIIDLLAKLEIDVYAPWAVAAMTAVGYFREHRLRKRVTSDLGTYVSRLERKIDPDRSTSGLSAVGQPPKEVPHAG